MKSLSKKFIVLIIPFLFGCDNFDQATVLEIDQRRYVVLDKNKDYDVSLTLRDVETGVIFYNVGEGYKCSNFKHVVISQQAYIYTEYFRVKSPLNEYRVGFRPMVSDVIRAFCG